MYGKWKDLSKIKKKTPTIILGAEYKNKVTWTHQFFFFLTFHTPHFCLQLF